MQARNGPEGFDYVVVGGGLAGCAVASRLSEDSCWRVILLLEAGQENTHEASYYGYGAHTLWERETDWHLASTPAGG